MNNQVIRGTWKLLEDLPTKNGPYLVAFEDSFGEFNPNEVKIWEFYNGEWFGETNRVYPTFYMELTMPRIS